MYYTNNTLCSSQYCSIFRDGKCNVRLRTGVIITQWWTRATAWNFPRLSFTKWNLTINRCPCLIVVMLLHYHTMHTSMFVIFHIGTSLEIDNIMLPWVTVWPCSRLQLYIPVDELIGGCVVTYPKHTQDYWHVCIHERVWGDRTQWLILC